MFNFFLPSHVKKGKRLLHGVKKFIHYHQDLMAETKLQEVRRARDDYAAVLETRDKGKLDEEEKRLLKVCEKAVPGYRSDSLKENIEVIIVAIIIALGIRAYFLQPFKIPTASMQPTLNGIQAVYLPPDQETPNILKQGWDFLVRGRNVAELKVPEGEPCHIVSVRQHAVAMFFTYCTVTFSNGKTDTVYAPARQLLPDQQKRDEFNLWNPAMQPPSIHQNIPQTDSFTLHTVYDSERNPAPKYQPGAILARGFVDTGDQVLVDKVSYHFRRPKRGEVFVFSTRGITDIPIPEGADSQHYIKRLVGVPGDNLAIVDKELYVNRQKATEPGIVRVMAREEGSGYNGYTHPRSINQGGVLPAQIKVNWTPETINNVQVEEFHLLDKQYFALGDNSANSLDSRAWGVVPEKNLVGPALMVYWPFKPHWWLIE